jgi:hypothetical protein
MTSQNVWIGITIGVFFAGLGIGFVIFSNSNQTMYAFHNQSMFNQMMEQNPQAMTWMMNEPQFRQQMFQQMMQDPDQMMEWMTKDPKHIEQMAKIMKEDHMFMSNMMSTMMNDPDLRFQMIGHMSENPEALQQMMSVWSSGNTTGMTGSHMMNNMMNDVVKP